jgi:hypothetical protein
MPARTHAICAAPRFAATARVHTFGAPRSLEPTSPRAPLPTPYPCFRASIPQNLPVPTYTMPGTDVFVLDTTNPRCVGGVGVVDGSTG